MKLKGLTVNVDFLTPNAVLLAMFSEASTTKHVDSL